MQLSRAEEPMDKHWAATVVGLISDCQSREELILVGCLFFMFISFARSNSPISLFGYLSSFLGFALLLIACPCCDDAFTKGFLSSLFVHFIWKDNIFNKSSELGTWNLELGTWNLDISLGLPFRKILQNVYFQRDCIGNRSSNS